MEQIKQGLNWLIGLELESKDLNAGQMSLRAVIVFALPIIMLRIGDKRFMGKNTAPIRKVFASFNGNSNNKTSASGYQHLSW